MHNNKIVSISFLFFRKPLHNLGKDIPLLLSTYVTPYVMNVIEIVYALDDFQKVSYLCLKCEFVLTEIFFSI